MSRSEDEDATQVENVWKERKDAEIAVRSYLSDLPSLFSFSEDVMITADDLRSPSYCDFRSWTTG